MSAPDVNLERQKNRHHTMIRGIWWGMGFAAVVAVSVVVATTYFGVDLAQIVPADTRASDG